VLSRWKEWAGEKEVKEWAGESTKSDKGLLDWLIGFSWSSSVQSGGNVFAKSVLRLDPESFREFLEPEQIVDRARKLSKQKSLTDTDRKIVDQFIKEYDIRSQGKNPSNEIMKRQ
jgi:hypothetical protein